MRRAGAAVIAGLLAFAAFAPTPARSSAAEESELLSLVNQLRSSRGLRPVVVHGELRALADDWARRMAAAQDIFHSSLDTRVGAGWIRLGENVAVDLSVVAAHRALEASPAHLANLVKPSYDYVGIGVAHGADGGIYIVEDFGSRAAGAVSPSPPEPPPAAPRKPTPAPARRAPRPGPSPSPSVPPSAPSRPRPAPPPPPPPPPPPEPSARLVDVFDRLRALDARVMRPVRDYGLVRRNS